MCPPVTSGDHLPRTARFVLYGREEGNVKDVFEASEDDPFEWGRIQQVVETYNRSGARGTVILIKPDLSYEEREYDPANPFQD
jgi:hypothetical protein